VVPIARAGQFSIPLIHHVIWCSKPTRTIATNRPNALVQTKLKREVRKESQKVVSGRGGKKE